MKRKLLATLLLVGVLMTMLPIFTLSASAETELHISTKEELLDFANALKDGETYAKQTVYIDNPIDMTGETWPLAGRANTQFSGMIDGQGHTITGLRMASTVSHQGLFGSYLLPVGDDPFIVGVKNLTVKASAVSGTSQTGGLFGMIGNNDNVGGVQFENLNLDIVVTATGDYCGGIAGVSRVNDMTIAGCILHGTVSGTAYVGGLIGQEMDQKLVVGDTVVSGTVKSNNINVGGFFGHVRERAGGHGSDTLVTNCVFDGTVETSFTEEWGNVEIGGFAGLVGAQANSAARPGKLTIEDSAFYGTLKLTGNGNVGKIGALVGSTNGGDNAVVTFRRILVAGGIEIAGAPKYNFGKLIGIAASTSTYVSDMVVENLTITVADKAATNWAWGNFSTNKATNQQTNQISAEIPVGYGMPVYAAGETRVDLIDRFVTTPATRPLPMGVLEYYADDIRAENDSTAPTNFGGCQDCVAEDGTLSVRLIGVLRCSEEEFAAIESVGLEIVVIRKDGTTVKCVTNLDDSSKKASSTQTVYTSILADGEKKDAESVKTGYRYLFTATVSKLPQDAGNVTFAVKSFRDINGTRIYDDMSVFVYGTDRAA